MRLTIRTSVAQNYLAVKEGFTQDLFLKLNPPFPPVRLNRFDGSSQGDIVELELNFILFRQTWRSLITEDGQTKQEWYFIDEGVKLPFFLKYWKHHHRVLKQGDGSQIVDDIHFRSPFWLMDFLLYPVLGLQFLYRKPAYKKFFST
jgi:ligand-binding SRPBCC domain-containing protein